MSLPPVAFVALTRSFSEFSGAFAEIPSRRRSTATVEFGGSGGPRPSDGLLLALSFPSVLRPPPARFCPPQQAPLPTSFRLSAFFILRFVSLEKKLALGSWGGAVC